MNQEDYIKQLEETNRQLQEKLEKSEINHEVFLERPVYIYCTKSETDHVTMTHYEVFDHISFKNDNGNERITVRYVTKLKEVAASSERGFNSVDYSNKESWDEQKKEWEGRPEIDLQITSQFVSSKSRSLPMHVTWTTNFMNDFVSIHSQDMTDVLTNGIAEDMNKSCDDYEEEIVKRIVKPNVDECGRLVRKPTKKEVAKYTKKAKSRGRK
jgi:hypothetical protein